jgi:hypothetical protein
VKIQVHPRVLADPGWHPLLDVVVSILEQPDSRHSFDISQYPVLKNSPWLSEATGLRANTAEFIRSSAKATSRDGASDAVALLIDDLAPQSGETLPRAVIRVHPLGALTILMQPLHLIVEDESSDGAFVLWMARLLGRDTLRRSYSAGRLLFRHAGGKGQMAKSAAALTFGVWPRENKPILSLQLRAIALLDSDAHFPGDQPNAGIVERLKPHVAFVHVLSGRYIEHYIPYRYVRCRMERDGLATAADAYFRMTEDQRNHFPIKKGFLDNSTPPQPQAHAEFLADARREQAERDHFLTVNPQDWLHFASGFGHRLTEIFQEPAYRCQPNEAVLLTQSQRAELNEFLTHVIRYL